MLRLGALVFLLLDTSNLARLAVKKSCPVE
jgi:hypothetical protein